MTPREQEVWERLGRVVDPELDEPVTELDFVSGLAASAEGDVRIAFRLPTYWCAANFAWLMAEDMRREVAALPWVRHVELTLDEHMYAEEINRGMRDGLSFRAAFGAEAQEEDVEDIRRIFALKAFQRRQDALLRHLLERGEAPEAMLALTVGALTARATEKVTGRLVRRYLERRALAGPASAEDLAFVDADGKAIDPLRLSAHLAALRSVAVNVEFNGVLCRSLLAARYAECGEAPAAEPGLLDFIRALPRAHP
jgi:metal-sulfur cluster biosynthetic enzyme